MNEEERVELAEILFPSIKTTRDEIEEKYPERRVFVFNSLTAGPEIALIIERIEELITEGREFSEICEDITKYSHKTGLLFMLESMKNLANNGRVSPIVAKMAGILGIRVVGKASDKGDLEPLNKCRGEIKALNTIVEHLKELGLKNGKVKIAHCFNEGLALRLKEIIETEFAGVKVEVYQCRGLCSFYAEKGGLLVGFEKATIKAVFTTGTTAAKLYKKFIEAETKIPAKTLPSTSPANAKVKFDELVEEYKIVLEYLN